MVSLAITNKITKEFLESFLREPVAKFSIEVGSKKGDNVAGDIYSILVETSSHQTLHLVYKELPQNNPMLAQFGKEGKIFDIEIKMYTYIANRIRIIATARGLSHELASLAIPKFYHGACTDEENFLVLEDERPAGYRMPNKYDGLNLDEIALILKELGRFHALTYFLIKYDGENIFDNVPGMERFAKAFGTDPATAGIAQFLFGTGYDIAMRIMETKIVEGDKKAERVRAAIDSGKAGAIVSELAVWTDKKTFPVLLLGDCWSNNILLKHDEVTKKPTSVKFIDFQQARRGNVYQDLLYFIFTSTTPQFRANHLTTVLSIYFDSFQSIIKALNCPGPLNFSKGQFLDTFHSGYIPIYIYMLYAIPLQLGKEAEEEEKPELAGGPVDREAIFGQWFEKLEKLYERTPEALERLEILTEEFMELNIL